MLGAEHSLVVDEQRCRQAAQPVLAAAFALLVDPDRECRPELGGEAPDDLETLLHIKTEHDQAAAGVVAIQPDKLGELLAAGWAPGCPEVHENGRTAEVAEADRLVV